MTDSLSRKRQPKGASHSQASIRHRLENYLLDHRRNLLTSFKRLCVAPFQTIMTVLVIAIAMALPAALSVGVGNVEQLGSGIEVSARMSVFIRTGATQDAIDELVMAMESREDVESTVYIGADEALAEFRQMSGFGEALSLLDENPLPHAIQVMPTQNLITDHQSLSALVAWVETQDIVDEVSLDLAWLQKLRALVELGRQAALGLGVILSIGVLLVMGNTIRLAIESRRDEIIVVKLIGGTDSYVCRPFLYAGFWMGLLAGVIAWILVWLGFWSLAGETEKLFKLYPSEYVLEGPGFLEFFALTGLGIILGLMGTWAAVYGHMKSIEPE